MPVVVDTLRGELSGTSMDRTSINILAIEDSEIDIRVARSILNNIPRFQFRLVHCSRLAEGMEALYHDNFDVVLLDLILPDSQGIESVTKLHARMPHMPIVVLTHMNDQVGALQAVRCGAQDYLVKGQFDGPLLSRAILYSMERKRAERAVQESLRQRQELEREVLEASTREQRRISQDLHDSVGQQLTGLSYMAKSLAKTLAAQSLPEAGDAEQVVEGIQVALNEVQNAIRGLAPVEVDADGLMVALRRLTETIETRFEIECRFSCHQSVPVEDHRTATHLYRIAQEALNNSLKHAEASHLLVRLEREDNRIQLQIRDDGQGMQRETNSRSGMGLHIMHYRAHAIGASLDISPVESGGTLITCSLPSGVPK